MSELTVNDRSLVIIAVDGNENVIIDGQGQNKILTVANASDKTFVIDGFTIQNGDAQTQDGQQQQNPEQKSGGNQRLGNLATGEEEMVESTIIVGNSSKGRVDCYI